MLTPDALYQMNMRLWQTPPLPQMAFPTVSRLPLETPLLQTPLPPPVPSAGVPLRSLPAFRASQLSLPVSVGDNYLSSLWAYDFDMHDLFLT